MTQNFIFKHLHAYFIKFTGICALAVVMAQPAAATSIALISGLQSELDTVKAGLEATGQFTSVTTLLDSSVSGPGDLGAYDAVLTWSDVPYANASQFGDALKAYVDTGGGVVTATYAQSAPWALAGGIAGSGYMPFQIGAPGVDPGSSVVATVPGDVIFNGIDLGTIGFFTNVNYIDPVLDVGAELLATNGAGIEMIARNAAGNVISANMFPGLGGSGDYFRLFGNMLLDVADADPQVAIPAPGALLLLGSGVLMLAARRRKAG